MKHGSENRVELQCFDAFHPCSIRVSSVAKIVFDFRSQKMRAGRREVTEVESNPGAGPPRDPSAARRRGSDTRPGRRRHRPGMSLISRDFRFGCGLSTRRFPAATRPAPKLQKPAASKMSVSHALRAVDCRGGSCPGMGPVASGARQGSINRVAPGPGPASASMTPSEERPEAATVSLAFRARTRTASEASSSRSESGSRPVRSLVQMRPSSSS
jgi:hypothetical protein